MSSLLMPSEYPQQVKVAPEGQIPSTMELSALLCHRVAMPKSGTQTINLMVDSLKV